MDIRQLCLFCLSFLSALGVYAQAEQKDSTVQDNKGVLITLTDGIATTVRHTGRKIRKVGKEFNAVDTTYISPNLYNLAFMLESSSWYEYYRLGSKGNNGEQSLRFSPNASFKLGVYFGWRWIFLGYSFDVKDIFGGHKNKAKKTEMALNLYSSKFGVDLYYRKTGSDFKIRSSSGFEYSDYSINVGYGYNWVFAKNWVSNLSLLPAIAYKKSKIDDTPNTDNHWIKDINFDLITRAAVVYNTNKYFVGASLVMHTYDYRKRNFSLTNTFGTVRVYAGFNFWKRKEFRDK